MTSLTALARPAASLLLAAALAACATTGANEPQDPWEGLNRKTYAFYDAVDQAVLKPVAQGYQKVVPAYARERISNFYGNLEDIGTSLNNFLQGKPVEAINDFGRVIVNTTFGILGFWDVATPLGVEKHYEDFGQTLGWWGLPSGPYLVLPLLGPSTARDGPAKVVDPMWYYPKVIESDPAYWSFWVLDKVRTREELLKSERLMEEAALDKYTFIRDAWLQRRRNQVYDGNPPRIKEED